MPAFPQCLAWTGGALAVGYPHGFRMWLMDQKSSQTRQICEYLLNEGCYADCDLMTLGRIDAMVKRENARRNYMQ